MNTKKIAKLLLGLADSFDTNDPDTTNYRADTLRQIANEIEPQPEPEFNVGDFVKYDIDTYLRVIEPSGKDKTLCKTLSGVIVLHPYTSCLTKASPSEVVIRIGCLEGTVAPGCSDTTIMIVPIGYDGMGEVAIIPVAMLDPDTRELVESLLRAQEEKCQ